MSLFIKVNLMVGGVKCQCAVYTVRSLAKNLRKKKCRDPGSNRGPSDLQSDALPTELSRHTIANGLKMFFE